MNIAVIMTCHNRKAKTLVCLESLFWVLPKCEVYLTDDGCTDGTADEVNKCFPHVTIIKGDGNLFWSRGMYMAWKEAVKKDYDFYLWLNDDTCLYHFFWNELMACYQMGNGNCIISGLIENEEKTEILYGGRTKDKSRIVADANLQEIRYMNGNVVLVPRSVVEKIGIIDPYLHHDLGDVDYGLTAYEHGIKVFSTRKAVGMGYPNNFCRVREWNSTLRGRFKRLNSPLGSDSKIAFYYRKKHFGFLKAVLFISHLYLINLLPDWAVKWIWGDKYQDK